MRQVVTERPRAVPLATTAAAAAASAAVTAAAAASSRRRYGADDFADAAADADAVAIAEMAEAGDGRGGGGGADEYDAARRNVRELETSVDSAGDFSGDAGACISGRQLNDLRRFQASQTAKGQRAHGRSSCMCGLWRARWPRSYRARAPHAVCVYIYIYVLLLLC